MMLNLTTMQSWFLGLLLSATSVSISVQALKEMNQLKSREGTTILGAAVIDDVLVIIALAFLK
jgi:Kef-type K+ transport system membrane component KefB